MSNAQGFLYLVSTGPGGPSHLTEAAKEAVSYCRVVVGYRRYLEYLSPILEGKEVLAFEMGQERARADAAIDLATRGEKVALVSGGDVGVYGMAGFVFRCLQERGCDAGDLRIEIIPGVTAATAAAALLGAPLTQDFVVLSLSDRYIPWPVIERRLELAAQADFVIVLYEPRSRLRPRHIHKAHQVVSRYRPAHTPVGIVRDAYRFSQEVTVTSLGEMLGHTFDMRTTVVIGNSVTRRFRGKMVTARGYPSVPKENPPQGEVGRPNWVD